MGVDNQGNIKSGYTADKASLSDATNVTIENGALLTGVVGNSSNLTADQVEVSGDKTEGVQGNRYFASGLSPDTYKVTVVGTTTDSKSGYDTQTKALAENVKQLEINLNLTDGSKLAGNLGLPTGTTYPVTMYFVNKATGEVTTVVSTDGSYNQLLPAGQYDVYTVDNNNANSGKYTFDNSSGTGTPTLTVATAFGAGSLIKGKVIQNGSAVSGATVKTKDEADVTTYPNGTYYMSNVNKASKQTFTAEKTNATGVKVVSVPSSVNVNISISQGMLVNSSHKVTVISGMPAVGANVEITYGGRTLNGSTDSEGNFIIAGVPTDWAEKTVSLYVSGDREQTYGPADKQIGSVTDNKAKLNLENNIQITSIKTGDIVGSAKDEDNNIVSGATVKLYYGADEVASTSTNDQGQFKIEDVPHGIYRLEISTNDGRKVTIRVTLANDEASATVAIPAKKKNTEVEQSGDVPPIVADIPLENFANIASEGDKGFTYDEVNSLETNNNASLLLRLEVNTLSEEDAANDGTEILDTTTGNTSVAAIFDIKLYKEVSDGSNTTVQELSEINNEISVRIRVPDEYQDKTSQLSLFTIHNDVVKKIEPLTFEKDPAGIYYAVFTTNEFSTYSLVYTEPPASGGWYPPEEDEPTDDEQAKLEQINKVKNAKLMTRTKKSTLKGRKSILISWYMSDGSKINTKDFDGFQVFRSTKKNSGYGKKPFFTSKTTKYNNNKNLKKGKLYYYKVRGFKVIDGKTYYTAWSKKGWNKIK